MFTHELMHRIFGLALLSVVVGCGTADQSQSPSTPDPDPTATPVAAVKAGGPAQLLRSAQSACKKNTAGTYSGPASSLSLTLQTGGALEIVHLDVQANCASKIAATVQVSSGTILMVETITNPGEAAFCMCTFDVSALVAGLAAGTYQVSAQSPDGQLTGPVSITIPPAAPVPTLQSACKKSAGSGPVGATLKTSLQGSTLTVEHDDVMANCAAKLAMTVTVVAPAAGQPGSIHVVDVVTNPTEQANCYCHFDLSTSISGLAPGSYELTANGPDGALTGPITVVIP